MGNQNSELPTFESRIVTPWGWMFLGAGIAFGLAWFTEGKVFAVFSGAVVIALAVFCCIGIYRAKDFIPYTAGCLGLFLGSLFLSWRIAAHVSSDVASTHILTMGFLVFVGSRLVNRRLPPRRRRNEGTPKSAR